jgi:hypothetical protein
MSELLPFIDVQTNQILMIAGYFKREPKKKTGNVTAEYSRILQRKARKYIDEWLMKGVPPVTFDKLARSAQKSHMTYLLKLLIEYQPLPAYDSLPATGQQLLYIDGRDVVNQRNAQTLTSSQTPSSTEQPTRKKRENRCLYPLL